MRARSVVLLALVAPVVAFALVPQTPADPPSDPLPANHLDVVMTSKFCSECHPAIYAEHTQNTHGRAFSDPEVRLATGRFDHGDCIRCHTPRPIFETGNGLNPLRRHHNLEEGNTCMSCHWKPGTDYASFRGGSECGDAFDDRVGTVEACASCHRNHGTPYQWEKAPTGKLAGRVCVDCHMKEVTRPVAVGEAPKKVRSHVFPGARSASQLQRAYRYDAALDGNEVVVKVTNKGAGHHFPTELKQRSVESLIVVRDPDGVEISRSRMVFRDPYKRPYGLTLPVNTQIPPGETREHRMPIKVAAGTVSTELHFKLYFPIEDNHPDLARELETRTLVFDGITPSDKPVETAPDVKVVTPESVSVDVASPANLVDFSRPAIGTVEITVPDGDTPEVITKLIELFQFPVPEGNRLAQARLLEIGPPAVPALIEALGSWDNKTWHQAQSVLGKMGEAALPAVLDALDHEQLYVRAHARELLPLMGWLGNDDAAVARLVDALGGENAVDRETAAETLGALGLRRTAPSLRPLLTDRDPDVVRAAALALAAFGVEDAVPDLERALHAATFAETKRDLATALATLGSDAGIPILLDGLEHPDDLIREDYFESFFSVTGVHLAYDPLLPPKERLAALSDLQAWWMRYGGPDQLRRPPQVDEVTDAHAWKLVSKLGGGAGIVPGGEDRALVDELVGMGEDAVPALLLGLKFPAGFADKRALVCEALGRIGSRDAAPALAGTLRDPVVAVAAWACWALESVADEETIPALRRYQDRLRSAKAFGTVPEHLGSADALLAQAARTRLLIGDRTAKNDLVALLLSPDPAARTTAIDALEAQFEERRGYEPDAAAESRREAVKAWSE